MLREKPIFEKFNATLDKAKAFSDKGVVLAKNVFWKLKIHFSINEFLRIILLERY